MPFVEVIHASDDAATVEQKRAFSEDMTAIFGEVLGTPRKALRIVFYPLAAEDSSAGLLESNNSA